MLMVAFLFPLKMAFFMVEMTAICAILPLFVTNFLSSISFSSYKNKPAMCSILYDGQSGSSMRLMR